MRGRNPTTMSTLVSAFPPARNHIRADELIAATDSFFLETWLFASQEERDLFVRCDYGSFISKSESHTSFLTHSLAQATFAVIPDGEFEKMIWACRASTLLFLTDDWIEKQVCQSASSSAGFTRPYRSPTQSPA
jgi:Leu/Phe-tRNA-protein transferase